LYTGGDRRRPNRYSSTKSVVAFPGNSFAALEHARPSGRRILQNQRVWSFSGAALLEGSLLLADQNVEGWNLTAQSGFTRFRYGGVKAGFEMRVVGRGAAPPQFVDVAEERDVGAEGGEFAEQ
jgi:hypothetical protein